MPFQKGHTINNGRKASDETKKKMSEFQKGKFVSDETRLKIGLGNKDKIVSEETRKKISFAISGENHHNWKGGKFLTKKGYVIILKHEHPLANKLGYVREHRLVMEEFIGRYLTKEEVVHHINGVKSDNRIENLMLFKNESEHQKWNL